MTGPMPSLLPGYSCWTALASTWAAEWRITSSAAPLLPLWLMMDRTSYEWSVVSGQWSVTQKRLPPWDEEATRGSTQVFAFERVDGQQPRSLL